MASFFNPSLEINAVSDLFSFIGHSLVGVMGAMLLPLLIVVSVSGVVMFHLADSVVCLVSRKGCQ